MNMETPLSQRAQSYVSALVTRFFVEIQEYHVCNLVLGGKKCWVFDREGHDAVAKTTSNSDYVPVQEWRKREKGVGF